MVDDDRGCLESLESLLILDGHATFTASRGEEALLLARRIRRQKERLDVSIIDFHMPDLSGIETFRRLLEELPSLEGIFISGDASDLLGEKVRRAGGRALVRKPLDIVRVRSVLLGLLEGTEFVIT